MVIDWGGGLLMFFKPLSKCSWGFTYVFLIAVNPATLKSIDDSTLFQDWILILGGHQEALDGVSSFKVHLHTMFATDLIEGNYAFPTDLKDAYLHVPIVKHHCHFLYLGWQHKHYQWKVLPFMLAKAPRVFPHSLNTYCSLPSQGFLSYYLFGWFPWPNSL